MPKKKKKVVHKSQTNRDGKDFFVFVDGAETFRERNPVPASLHFIFQVLKTEFRPKQKS